MEVSIEQIKCEEEGCKRKITHEVGLGSDVRYHYCKEHAEKEYKELKMQFK